VIVPFSSLISYLTINLIENIPFRFQIHLNINPKSRIVMGILIRIVIVIPIKKLKINFKTDKLQENFIKF
jgi:hypothetical protein